MIPIGRLVLDTSAYFHLHSGHQRLLDWVAGGLSSLPAIVLGELQAGFEHTRGWPGC